MVKKGKRSITSKHRKQLLSRYKNFNYIGVALLIIFSFTFGSLLTKQTNFREKNDHNVNKPNTITPYPTQQPLPTSTPFPTPDFSNESVKPRTQFDLSAWKTYENVELGLRFKYPPEWGTPNGGLSNKCYGSDDCSNDNKTAWTFRLKFPNSDFEVDGASRNYIGPGTDNPDYMFFKGFYFIDPQFCNQDWVGYCKKTIDTIDYFSFATCYQGGVQYNRILQVDLPTKMLSGLEFGGGVIPKNKYSYYYDLISFEDYGCNKLNRDAVGKAIMDRKIDSEIIQVFDSYEKVFETIEII